MESSAENPPIENAEFMLPPQGWIALLAATDNRLVAKNFRSFGFSPYPLERAELRAGGGSVELAGGSSLAWAISGPGRGPATIGVHLAMVMPDDRPDAAGHHVDALITGAVLGQPGELRVDGSALEPFLLPGERQEVRVHSMPKLEADVVWQRRPDVP